MLRHFYTDSVLDWPLVVCRGAECVVLRLGKLGGKPVKAWERHEGHGVKYMYMCVCVCV